MEGQIGGKSGPGVLRTRQSGDLGAWGEAWEGPGGGPRLLLRRSTWFCGVFTATASRVSSKQGNKETHLSLPSDRLQGSARWISISISISVSVSVSIPISIYISTYIYISTSISISISISILR